MSDHHEPIDLDDLQRVAALARERYGDNWVANMIELASEEVARLREERLTDEERDAVAGIALVLGRLKIYPEQVGRTKQNDLDLLWRIAGEREVGE